MDFVFRLAALAVGFIVAAAGAAKLASPSRLRIEDAPAVWAPLLRASHSTAFAVIELLIALLLPLVEHHVALALCYGAIALLALGGLFVQFALPSYDCKCFGVLTPKRKGSIQLAHAALFVLALSVAIRESISPPLALVVPWQMVAVLATAIAAVWSSIAAARRGSTQRPAPIARPVPSLPAIEPLAPSFDLGHDLGGTMVTLGSLAKADAPVFIVGVHSACKTCKALLPDIERFARGFADQFPIVVIADKLGYGSAGGAAFIMLVDEREQLAMKFNVDGRPFALVINGATLTPIAPPSLGDNAVRILFAVTLNARLPVTA